MTTTGPARFALAPNARAVLDALTAYHDLDNFLTDEQIATLDALPEGADANLVNPGYLDVIEGDDDTLRALIYFAWEANIVTGPGEPCIVTHDADCHFTADLGNGWNDHVRIATRWGAIRRLYDPETSAPVERAMSVLDVMVGELNAALDRLDAYIASRAA